MSSNTTISIGWKIEDAGNGFRTVTMSAEDLRRVLRATAEEAERVQRNFLNFAAVCTSIDSVSSTIDSLKSVVDDLAGAYDIQIGAETKLEQVMRNTMGATEEQIQSIKDFCSAQQQIGVVGDEVQLAGAQELATYLELTGSLKRLIPVMNDMLVQQYGLEASGEAAAQIASMLGKVMEGQTGSLSRYGYKFDEAQEKILKYGTETERVAVLVDVVSQSVGGMNQAMAQTEPGKMQQLANNLGDMKEQLGEIAKKAQAPLTIGANAVVAFGGVVKLVKGMKDLITVLNLTKAAAGWITLAIGAIGSLLVWLLTKSNEAADSFDRLSTAEERAAHASEMAKDVMEEEDNARRSAISSLQIYISKIENFNGTKTEEKKLVTELNNTYGSTMGYFQSLTEWYQALITNSKAYCQQMVNEAKARMLANQIAELEINRDKIVKDERGKARMYSKEQEFGWKYNITPEERQEYEKKGYTIRGQRVAGKYVESAYIPQDGTSDWEKATDAVKDYNEQIKNLKESLKETQATKIEMPEMGSPEAPEWSNKNTGSGKTRSVKAEEEIPEGSIADYKRRIADIQKKITFSIDDDETLRLEQQKMELEKKITALEIPVKIAHSSEKFEEDWEDINPIEIPVKVDAASLDASLKELPQGVNTVKSLKETLGDVGGLISATSSAFKGMGKAFEMPELDVMGIIAGSIATMIQGFASASSQAATLGPIGWAAFGLEGLAQLMTMINQIKSVTPFANGGIVSGPTLGLVGEYAGASSNPEVIAPLDKLKDIIGTTQQGGAPVIIGGRVEIDGRKLAVVLENQTRIAGASGRRYK